MKNCSENRQTRLSEASTERTHLLSREVIVVFLLTILFTNMMRANAGTGFFLPGILHVLLGNIIIGFVEALFIRKVFSVSARYGMVIAGNYVSSILGYFIVIAIFSDIDLLSISVLPFSLGVMFLISVLIEWPFVVKSVKNATFGFSWRSFKYVTAAQVISYALLVPYHFLTFDEGRLSDRQYVEIELQNLGSHADMFQSRYHIYGGGGGSYRGFVLDQYPKDEGYFSASSSRDSIVFSVMSLGNTRTLVRVVLDSAGKLHSWQYNFTEQEQEYKKRITYLLRLLPQIVQEYRARPYREPGGKKTFIGYAIPPASAVTAHARYTATVSSDSIVFVATSLTSSDTLASAVVDSAGRLHGLKWSEKIGQEVPQ